MLWLSAAIMLLTAAVHSVLGERRLIGPILDMNSGVVAKPLGRNVLRFAWHVTSLLMILSALTLLWPGTDRTLIAIIGGAWLAAGMVDAVMTRGRHIGWPALAAAGLFALTGAGA